MTNPNFLKKVKTESVLQQVMNSLTNAIINRNLRPGDKLPTENELAESLGVGRNSVREAIKMLVCLGVLEIRRPEGTFVVEGFSESMIDPMIYGIILDASDSYDHLMELRELMEVGVMRLTIHNHENMDQLTERLRVLKDEISKGKDYIEESFQADNDFHETISLMGKNPVVHKINQVVRVLTHSLRYNTVKRMIETNRGQELFEAHQKIYDIIASGNVDNINEAVRTTYFVQQDDAVK